MYYMYIVTSLHITSLAVTLQADMDIGGGGKGIIVNFPEQTANKLSCVCKIVIYHKLSGSL